MARGRKGTTTNSGNNDNNEGQGQMPANEQDNGEIELPDDEDSRDTRRIMEEELWAHLSVEQKLAWVEKERQREHELKLEELKLRESSNVVATQGLGPDDNLERYAKRVRACALKAPQEDVEIPTWLNTIERVFEFNNVPKSYWGRILIPLLPERARGIIGRLSNDELISYDTLKINVLKQCKMDPHTYLSKFNEIRKNERETWVQFAEKLSDLLEYYWESRGVDSLEKAKDLSVADNFKRKLPEGAREYVVLHEGSNVMSALELAELAQKFEEAKVKSKVKSPIYNPPERDVQSQSNFVNKKGFRFPSVGVKVKREPSQGDNTRARQMTSNNRNKQCFNCHQWGHVQARCPANNRSDQTRQVPRDSAAVNTVTEGEASAQEINSGNSLDELPYRNVEAGNAAEPTIVAKVTTALKGISQVIRNKLEKVEVRVNGTTIEALVDSGAQITVINPELASIDLKRSEGKIQLIGAFGATVSADIVTIRMSLAGQGGCADIVCATTKELKGGLGCLITPLDLQALKEAGQEFVENYSPHLDIRTINAAVGEPQGGGSTGTAGKEGNDGDESGERYSCVNDTAFMSEQKNDAELGTLWEQAKTKTHGMFIRNGILYHHENLNGIKVDQLVAPKDRRAKILEMAHDSQWAGHLGSRKTAQRIRTAFYWPGMAREIRRFVQSCHHCQMRTRPKTIDRVPIKPLIRPETAFQIVNIDIVGPIDPPSSRGHKWILSLIDLTTRWPEIVPLRSLNAKSSCEALLGIFARTGLPIEISCDQGSGFIANLTQELMNMLKVNIRFSTANHPNSNGTVERWNGTLKNMLAHVVRERGRDWDKALPYIAWAYREVPNESTKMSPFQLLYGRVPHGPLTLLAREWTQEQGSLVLNESYNDYSELIRKNIRDALERAESAAAEMQTRYTARYNLRAREKTFKNGELVLVIKRNPDNKLDQKWEGPAVVLENRREDSYVVEMPTGRLRWVHADNMKQYYSRVAAIGVTFDDEEEFGEIEWAPTGRTRTESEALDRHISLEHLTEKQKKEIGDIIVRFSDVFSDQPGRTNMVEHKIQLVKGFTVQRARPYRIPIALRDEVDRQIQELLKANLIEPAESDMAFPIVCAAKRDGSFRICVDYRKLNAGTVPDAFPMPNTSELILQIANARYITVMDMARGYWQVPMSRDSRELTAFVTDTGTYAWKEMPFGLRNAAATFQRLMNKVLASHRRHAVAYMDDVAVYSNSWNDHVNHLKGMLEALRNAGLHANPLKCKFAHSETEYLGKIVGSGRHAVDESRVEPVKQKLRPRTKKELRQFLGFAGYYREYIPGYAAVALPLTELTGRRTRDPIPWSEEAEAAFQSLKQRIADLPKLYAPMTNRPFYIFSDASDRAVGACLAQLDDDGKERPIAFASQKLTPMQRRWAAIEREAYAVVWSLKRFDTWVYGNEIVVISDHNPLSYLTDASPRGGKLTRWALALQRYSSLKIRHRKGSDHVNADWLSRIEDDDCPE